MKNTLRITLTLIFLFTCASDGLCLAPRAAANSKVHENLVRGNKLKHEDADPHIIEAIRDGRLWRMDMDWLTKRAARTKQTKRVAKWTMVDELDEIFKSEPTEIAAIFARTISSNKRHDIDREALAAIYTEKLTPWPMRNRIKTAFQFCAAQQVCRGTVMNLIEERPGEATMVWVDKNNAIFAHGGKGRHRKYRQACVYSGMKIIDRTINGVHKTRFVAGSFNKLINHEKKDSEAGRHTPIGTADREEIERLIKVVAPTGTGRSVINQYCLTLKDGETKTDILDLAASGQLDEKIGLLAQKIPPAVTVERDTRNAKSSYSLTEASEITGLPKEYIKKVAKAGYVTIKNNCLSDEDLAILLSRCSCNEIAELFGASYIHCWDIFDKGHFKTGFNAKPGYFALAVEIKEAHPYRNFVVPVKAAQAALANYLRTSEGPLIGTTVFDAIIDRPEKVFVSAEAQEILEEAVEQEKALGITRRDESSFKVKSPFVRESGAGVSLLAINAIARLAIAERAILKDKNWISLEEAATIMACSPKRFVRRYLPRLKKKQELHTISNSNYSVTLLSRDELQDLRSLLEERDAVNPANSGYYYDNHLPLYQVIVEGKEYNALEMAAKGKLLPSDTLSQKIIRALKRVYFDKSYGDYVPFPPVVSLCRFSHEGLRRIAAEYRGNVTKMTEDGRWFIKRSAANDIVRKLRYGTTPHFALRAIERNLPEGSKFRSSPASFQILLSDPAKFLSPANREPSGFKAGQSLVSKVKLNLNTSRNRISLFNIARVACEVKRQEKALKAKGQVSPSKLTAELSEDIGSPPKTFKGAIIRQVERDQLAASTSKIFDFTGDLSTTNSRYIFTTRQARIAKCWIRHSYNQRRDVFLGSYVELESVVSLIRMADEAGMSAEIRDVINDLGSYFRKPLNAYIAQEILSNIELRRAMTGAALLAESGVLAEMQTAVAKAKEERDASPEPEPEPEPETLSLESALESDLLLPINIVNEIAVVSYEDFLKWCENTSITAQEKLDALPVFLSKRVIFFTGSSDMEDNNYLKGLTRSVIQRNRSEMGTHDMKGALMEIGREFGNRAVEVLRPEHSMAKADFIEARYADTTQCVSSTEVLGDFKKAIAGHCFDEGPEGRMAKLNALMNNFGLNSPQRGIKLATKDCIAGELVFYSNGNHTFSIELDEALLQYPYLRLIPSAGIGELEISVYAVNEQYPHVIDKDRVLKIWKWKNGNGDGNGNGNGDGNGNGNGDGNGNRRLRRRMMPTTEPVSEPAKERPSA